MPRRIVGLEFTGVSEEGAVFIFRVRQWEKSLYAMNREALFFFLTSVNFYQISRRHFQEKAFIKLIYFPFNVERIYLHL